MRNAYRSLLSLLPSRPLQIGVVEAQAGGVATIELLDGTLTTARGSASVGARVFVRDGLIEGTAPSLTFSTVEV